MTKPVWSLECLDFAESSYTCGQMPGSLSQDYKITNVMQHAKTNLFSLKWDSELLYYSTRGCL